MLPLRSRCFHVVLVLAGLLSAVHSAAALCLDDRKPTLRQEFASSHMAATGRVVAKRDMSDPDDAEGIARTLYDVELTRIFKGPARQRIQVISENTSSRFPMDVGTEYLLFLQQSDREYFVDSCGNSDEALKRQVEIAAIRASIRRK